jgi:hypothetical protein
MIETLVLIAGLVQLAVAGASLAIPRMLGWKEQTAKLDELTRQVFWTYAGYILGTNVFFGVVSTVAPHWLTDSSGLARTLCGFIATYWGVRVVIQFTAYRGVRPQGVVYRLAEVALLLAFIYCTVIYGAVMLALV